jgi:hypothetical protein
VSIDSFPATNTSERSGLGLPPASTALDRACSSAKLNFSSPFKLRSGPSSAKLDHNVPAVPKTHPELPLSKNRCSIAFSAMPLNTRWLCSQSFAVNSSPALVCLNPEALKVGIQAHEVPLGAVCPACVGPPPHSRSPLRRLGDWLRRRLWLEYLLPLLAPSFHFCVKFPQHSSSCSSVSGSTSRTRLAPSSSSSSVCLSPGSRISSRSTLNAGASTHCRINSAIPSASSRSLSVVVVR